jgi:hypothetical protein
VSPNNDKFDNLELYDRSAFLRGQWRPQSRRPNAAAHFVDAGSGPSATHAGSPNGVSQYDIACQNVTQAQ